MNPKPVLFLTGATGLIGGKLLPLLLAADPDQHVLVLARKPSSVNSERITVLAGDLTAPDLGLSHIRELADSITEIIHCAADTRFGLPLSDAREVNTEGTARVLQLARACPHLKKMAHISTVYVAGRGGGPWAEARCTNTAGFLNSYQHSKYEAEEMVAEAMTEIPVAVYRLSSIIGDSRTGRVEEYNYFHQLIKLVPWNPLPILPGIPDAPVDLIATDWVIAALSTLYESNFEAGRFYNLSAGPSHSLTVQEIVAATFEQIKAHSPRSGRVPEIVSLEEFEKFVSRRTNGGGDSRMREFLGTLSQFLPHLGIRQHFENGETLATLEAAGIELPPIRSFYPKVIQYCQDWHRGAVTPPEAALEHLNGA